MAGTLAAGSAVVMFFLAVVLIAITGFDRAAAAAVVVGLAFLSVSIASIAVDRRTR